jgi:spore coat protein U-like protein
MRRILISAAVAMAIAGGSVALAAGGATGQSTQAQFNVTATVVPTCSASANDVAFGNYTPGNGAAANDLHASTNVNVKCTPGAAFTVLLNAGAGPFSGRYMTGGPAPGNSKLYYNLYTDNTYATVFGDGTSSTGTVSGVGAGTNTAVPIGVYGWLQDSANAAAAAGGYTDHITATINY